MILMNIASPALDLELPFFLPFFSMKRNMNTVPSKRAQAGLLYRFDLIMESKPVYTFGCLPRTSSIQGAGLTQIQGRQVVIQRCKKRSPNELQMIRDLVRVKSEAKVRTRVKD